MDINVKRILIPAIVALISFSALFIIRGLICQVQEFVDQYLAQHELRKRIFKRFKEEGIEIPFPHRTVYLREEKEWQK